jgi:hypothetical protein
MTRQGNLQLGVGLVAIGVVLTIVTHNAGHGVIFYGLILVGGFRILRALAGE